MRHPLRILSLEDDPRDTELIQGLLEAEGMACEVTRVDTQAAFRAFLAQGAVDLILADYTLPAFDGISALKLAISALPDVPFIFVTGTLGEEVAIEALKIGATDFILKTRLSRLVPSVQRALREADNREERKLAEQALRRNEAYLVEAQTLSHTGSFGWNTSSGEIYWSEETYKIFEYERAVKPTLQLIFQRSHPDDRKFIQETIDRAIGARADLDFEHRLLLADGSIKYIHVLARAFVHPSGDLEYVGAVTDITERKQAEMKLRESEAYLAEAQRLTKTGSWAFNPSTEKTIYWSDEMLRIFELDPQRSDLPDREEFVRLIHPEDRDRFNERIEKSRREKADFVQDYRAVLTDGTVKHIHGIGHPVLDEAGNIVRFVGTDVDVTERKRAEEDRERAEEKIRQSEAYLAEAQRLSHTGSWAWDPVKGESRYWSDESFRMMGFDPAGGTPTFETVAQRFHPDDRPIFAEKLSRAIRERAEFEVDYRVIHPNGEIRDIHTIGHPVLGPSGELLEYVGTGIDVTERKRAEDKFRQSESELRNILDFAPQQVAVLGPDRTRIYSNQAMLRYFGLTLEEWQSGDPRRYVHPDDFERMMDQDHGKFLNGLPHEIELRLRGTDEKYRWFLVRYRPLRDEQGRITRWYLAGTDIEDRKQREESLRTSQAVLAHANRVTTMGELAASLAHEVNQPIAAAVTNAYACLRWLDRDQPDLVQVREAAMRVVQDGLRAGEIISRIRSQFKKETLKPELVDVNEVIGGTIALLRGEAVRSHIAVRTELAAGLPQIMGDRIQLQQVMMNLIVNSIDAMKDVDGTREIAIKSQRTENEQLLVSVSDTGIGLPPQQENQIFDAFFTTKPNGTGMGLRICRSIIESHGGRLWADGNQGRGAAFQFTLPATVADNL